MPEPHREKVDLTYFARRFWQWGNLTAPLLNHYWWETLWWTVRAAVNDIVSIQVEEEGVWQLLESERVDRIKLEQRVIALEKQIKAMTRGRK